MNLMRRPILFELGLCLIMGLPIGCTTGAMNTGKQNLDLLVESKAAFQQGRTDRALEIASEAVRVAPDRAEAWNARGFFYASQGRDGAGAQRPYPSSPIGCSQRDLPEQPWCRELESGKADLRTCRI